MRAIGLDVHRGGSRTARFDRTVDHGPCPSERFGGSWSPAAGCGSDGTASVRSSAILARRCTASFAATALAGSLMPTG